MPATWEEIQRLRRDKAPGTSDTTRIIELLEELGARDELDAKVQLQILALDEKVRREELKPCEAFANGMGLLAELVRNQPMPETPFDSLREAHRRRRASERDRLELPPSIRGPLREALRRRRALLRDRLELPPSIDGPRPEAAIRLRRAWALLQLSWSYLISEDDRTTYYPVSVLVGHEPKGGWQYSEPVWTGHLDAQTGSGFMPPRPDDATQDRGGRKAHFIANAVMSFTSYWLGNVPRLIWATPLMGEDSSTDNEVNRLGTEFGRAVAGGDLDDANIASWVQKFLCTEGKCPAASISPELLKRLRWAVLAGRFESHYEEKTGSHDPRHSPKPLKRESEYTRDNTVTLAFRAAYVDEESGVRFGRVLEGSSKTTHGQQIIEDGKAESRSFVDLANLTRVTGVIKVTGSEEWKGWYSIHLEGFQTSPEQDKRWEESGIGSHDPFAGWPTGFVCQDETLSGSDSKTIGADTWFPSPAPVQFSTTETYSVYEKGYRRADWSWTIQIQPAEEPKHAEKCTTNYIQEDESIGAAIRSLTMVIRTKLQHFYSEAYRTNRPEEAAAVDTEAMMISTIFIDQERALGDLGATLDGLCSDMRSLWLSDNPQADSNYAKRYSEFEENLAKREALKKSIVDQINLKIIDMADRVRSIDSLAASDLERIASEFERDRI